MRARDDLVHRPFHTVSGVVVGIAIVVTVGHLLVALALLERVWPRAKQGRDFDVAVARGLVAPCLGHDDHVLVAHVLLVHAVSQNLLGV